MAISGRTRKRASVIEVNRNELEAEQKTREVSLADLPKGIHADKLTFICQDDGGSVDEPQTIAIDKFSTISPYVSFHLDKTKRDVWGNCREFIDSDCLWFVPRGEIVGMDTCLNKDEVKGPAFGCRHVQACLLCLALVIGIGTRNNLSIAIVAMTDNSTSPNPDVVTYDWGNTSIILSSFFWSYITIQVLAGYLAKHYGPKYFLLATFLINSGVVAGTPLAAATLGSGGVMLCRILQGFSQGFLYPSIHVMMGTWVPEQERATINNFVFSGVGIGSMFASLLTGYVSSSWWGWPFSFYILAFMGILWCILWAFFGQSTPSSHPRITIEEKEYIIRSLKQNDEILPVPWRKIFTSVPMYAILVAYIGSCWGSGILSTETPTYLNKVMHYSVKSSALITSLPIAIGLVASYITGPLSDWLITNQYLSTLNTRRTFNSIGAYGHALCLLWLSCLTVSEAYMSVIIFGLSSALSSCVLVGSNVNHLDLSPRFSGIIFGMLNAVGQIASLAAPLAAQWLITDVTSTSQWRIVFITTVVFYVAGGTVFFFFASATRQSWDGPEDKDLQERRKKISVISFTGV